MLGELLRGMEHIIWIIIVGWFFGCGIYGIGCLEGLMELVFWKLDVCLLLLRVGFGAWSMSVEISIASTLVYDVVRID